MVDPASYALLLPWGHRLAEDGNAARVWRIAELAREPLALIKLPDNREYFLSPFRNAGVTPTIAHESASLEMVRGLVANGSAFHC